MRLSKRYVRYSDMRYSVMLTPHATAQIGEAVSYISKVLLVPETAKAWADYLEKEIKSLDTLPERYRRIEEEPWRSLGFRVMVVKNFNVYYFVDDEKKTVWVTAVIYGKRDQLNALKELPDKTE